MITDDKITKQIKEYQVVRSKFSNSEEISMFDSDNETEIEATVNFNAIGAIVDRLTDIYENPAVASTRETFSNAYDATMKEYKNSGIKNPIRIELPVISNNYTFSISDNGSGMSKEDIINVYRVYGETTKDNDLSSTGSFGIGAKAPLAIVKSFDVVSVKDGMETSFSFVRNIGQLPKIHNLKTKETNSKNGTKVSYQVVSDDEYGNTEKREMINDIIKTSIMLKNFSVDFDVIIENLELADLSYFGYHDAKMNNLDLKKDYTHALNITHEDEIYRLFVKKDSITSSDFYNLGRIKESIVENITYLLNGYLYYDDSQELNYIFELKVGAVDFPSSRDKILTNSKFISLKNSIKDSITNDSMFKIISSVLSSSENKEVACFIKKNYSNKFSVEKGLYESFLSLVYKYNNTVSDNGKIVELNDDFKYFANKLSKYVITESICDSKLPFSGYSFNKSKSKALYNSTPYKKSELNKMFKEDLMYFNGLIDSDKENKESFTVEKISHSIHRSLDVEDNFLSYYKKPCMYLVLDGYSKTKEDIAKYSARVDIEKVIDDNLCQDEENITSVKNIYNGEELNVLIPHSGKLTDEDKEFIKHVESITKDRFIIVSGEEKLPIKKRLSNYDNTEYKVFVYSSIDEDILSLTENINTNGYNMSQLFSKHSSYGIDASTLSEILENWDSGILNKDSRYKDENESIESYDNVIIMTKNTDNYNNEIVKIINSYIDIHNNDLSAIINKRFFVTDYIKVKSLQSILENNYEIYRYDDGKKVAKYYDNIPCIEYKNVDESIFRHYLSVATEENKIKLYNSFISNMRSINRYSYEENIFNKSVVEIIEYIENNNAEVDKETKELLYGKKRIIEFVDTLKKNRYTYIEDSYFERMTKNISYSSNESEILRIILDNIDSSLIEKYGLTEKHNDTMELQDYEEKCENALSKGFSSIKSFIEMSNVNEVPVEIVTPYINYMVKKSLLNNETE